MLQGLLMILPQSKTFTVLKTRLECVNVTNFELPFIDEKQEEAANEDLNKQFILNCIT
jgi:hypothetical protein